MVMDLYLTIDPQVLKIISKIIYPMFMLHKTVSFNCLLIKLFVTLKNLN